MWNKFIVIITLITGTSCLISGCTSCNDKARENALEANPKVEEVIGIIRQVNDAWQKEHPQPDGNAFWHYAAYHTGNMAAYEITGEEAYKDYSEQWAEFNEWKGAKSNDYREWRYDYGETDEYVLFGDWQICFQVYIDLYLLDLPRENRKIERAIEVMEYQMATPDDDYWWWVDGLYMVMPVMTKLYNLTNNPLYPDKLYQYFTYAKNLMYDPEEHLFYRDAKYIYPQHTTLNGQKDFWARGNGWIFAALPKVLTDLPVDAPYREEYLQIYKELAIGIANSQQPEGYWTRSLIDPMHAPGPETSGTAFFTYGFLWGINNGILDRELYEPVADNAWDYLIHTALQPDGRLGYVQPIGEKAIPGQVIDLNSTADFGVGAFLLAASERVRYEEKR